MIETEYFNFTDMSFESADITPAVQLLLRGEIIVLPTDTVYGFHSIVREDLKHKINEIKGCDKDKPLIILDVNFKPPFECDKPTTFIMDNVAIRNPMESTLADIIKLSGGKLYSTSANITGEEVMDNGKDIYEKFKGKVAAVFDVGKIEGKASKIIKCVKGEYITIRE
jgi:L-threonylcarbamoyladenylate synthase